MKFGCIAICTYDKFRMQRIFHPALRVIGYIFGNTIVIIIVTDDVFIIISLPYRSAGRAANFIDTPTCRTFKTTHHCPKIARWRRRGVWQYALIVGIRLFLFLTENGRIAIRPYDEDDAMKMVGHHHKFTAFDFRSNFCRSHPFRCHDSSICIQSHHTALDFTKYTFFVICANGHKIRSCLRIIISLQTKAATVTFVCLLGHIYVFRRGVWQYALSLFIQRVGVCHTPLQKRDASLLRAKSALRIWHAKLKNKECDADHISLINPEDAQLSGAFEKPGFWHHVSFLLLYLSTEKYASCIPH